MTGQRISTAGATQGDGAVTKVPMNGVFLACEQLGSGPVPVVMVHGGFSSRRTWSLVAPGLVETRRVILYDRRGHGESEPPAKGGSVRAHVSDLAGLIRRLGLAPAWVMGTSYGAQIALRLAAAEPALLRGVVAHEPGLLLSLIAEAAGFAPIVDELGHKEALVAKRIARGDHESAARELVETVLGPGAWPLLPAELRRMYVQNAPAVLAELEDPERNDFDPASLAGFRRPVLLTKGEESPSFFGVVVERFAAALPNAEVRRLTGAGHAPHMTHPDAYADTVGAFLRTHTK